jgi:signal transduction histidine kinase
MPDRLIQPRRLTWRTALLCGPLLLLIWMAASSYEDLRTHQERVSSSDRVLSLLSALIQIHAQLQQAESGQRAYLLTGKDEYLATFWNLNERADDFFRQMIPIVKAVPNGPQKLEHLKTLTLAKLAEMRKTIDLDRSHGQAAAVKELEAGTGQRYMIQICSDINEFVRETYSTSEAYRDASVKAATRTTLIVVLGASALFFLLAVATVLIERDQQQQRVDAMYIQDLNRTLEFKVSDRTKALEEANRELEAFCYSVSHDLRAPLRSVEGFSKMLARDYKDKPLDTRAYDLMNRMSVSTVRMGQLIDDLLSLSRIAAGGIEVGTVNLSALAAAVAKELCAQNPGHRVEVMVEADLVTKGDKGLLRVAIENLFGNAWKFTRRQPNPRLEFGQSSDGSAFFVRDNGVGFDMAHSKQLFVPFQRLHRDSQFEGTGIGLATVQRVIHSHGGRIWAESQPGLGATFYFTIESKNEPKGRMAIGEQEADLNGGGQSRRRTAHA